ncbi:phosphatase PAP2 family protein [Bdellovibrio svalbardensis]|uniref:Phosphatase PAP2 family protein n=1 Tax=Bdellovibrio svalbardensis TaxID=2972972 RepID=A0ABT6DR13_9BACT|nr:phosphatase PAP2 family protein [Bdellovibrio svalbardensis]MDG0818266.1 phosphatase PAP2 family protein [Bdellovibrio svalbardensis]
MVQRALNMLLNGVLVTGLVWSFPQSAQAANEISPVLVGNNSLYSKTIEYSNLESSLVKLGLISSIIIFASENEMLSFVQRNDGRVADQAADVGEFFGSRKMVPVLGMAYVLGVVVDQSGVSRVAKIAFKAGLINFLINDSLKLTFRRALPSETNDPFKVSEYDEAPRMGMPSGHASFAFALATAIAETSREEQSSNIIPVLAYGAATLTAWSRVYQNQHWVSDVLIGAIVGHFSAKLAMDEEKQQEGRVQVNIYPYFGRNAAGLVLSVTERSPQQRTCQPEEEGTPACFRKAFAKHLPQN